MYLHFAALVRQTIKGGYGCVHFLVIDSQSRSFLLVCCLSISMCFDWVGQLRGILLFPLMNDDNHFSTHIVSTLCGYSCRILTSNEPCRRRALLNNLRGDQLSSELVSIFPYMPLRHHCFVYSRVRYSVITSYAVRCAVWRAVRCAVWDVHSYVIPCCAVKATM